MKQKSRFRLHKIIYTLAGPVVAAMVLKYKYKTDKCPKLEGSYIVMANHTTERDMAMVRCAFRQHMYIVCGEHLLRGKYAGLLKTFVDPIPEAKGTVASGTVLEIIRRCKRGHNVMIFPEGSRSFNGETAPVSVAAGKMVRLAGCGLVTYRVRGGYFIAPRWGYEYRKGRASGKIVHIYTPEEIAAMTPQQITDAINADLYENAYEVQREAMEPYRGKNRAEGLENYLLKCPECGAYDSMVTEGNDFRCGCCSVGGTYDEYGFLRGEKLRFDSVYDWGKWMQAEFDADMKQREEGSLLFTDTDVRMYEILDDHTTRDIAQGDLRLYHDRMELGENVYLFREIQAMSMLYFGKTLLFAVGERNYGITGEHYHAWKANRLYELTEPARKKKRK